MEEQLQMLDSPSTFSSYSSDSDSLNEESVVSDMSSLSDVQIGQKRKLTESDLSVNSEENLPTDPVEKQRLRRQRRMNILRAKRQRKSCFDATLPRTEPLPVTTIVDDPQLLRKLRNRESAARSRQKIIDLIDDLTWQVIDRFVTLQDLQEQYNFLEGQRHFLVPDATQGITSFHEASYQSVSSTPTQWWFDYSSTSSSGTASPVSFDSSIIYSNGFSFPPSVTDIPNEVYGVSEFNGLSEDMQSLYQDLLTF